MTSLKAAFILLKRCIAVPGGYFEEDIKSKISYLLLLGKISDGILKVLEVLRLSLPRWIR